MHSNRIENNFFSFTSIFSIELSSLVYLVKMQNRIDSIGSIEKTSAKENIKRMA